jgi:hypothetical protein
MAWLHTEYAHLEVELILSESSFAELVWESRDFREGKVRELSYPKAQAIPNHPNLFQAISEYDNNAY